MKRAKVFFPLGLALCFWGSLFALVSCGKEGAVLRDGYYSAEAERYDSFGWKEFVTIGVSNGRITTVDYNAKNSSGFIKAWDTEYMRQMNAVNKTYPNEYTRFYAEQLLLKQDAGAVDTLTGATVSYRSFRQLAGRAIENAKTGDTGVSLVAVTDN